MIDVKDAVRIATATFANLMESFAPSEIVLEEVESTDDEKAWRVTLSALLPESKELSNTSPIAAAMASWGPTKRRVYKVLTIDAETGNMKSMKIRSPRTD